VPVIDSRSLSTRDSNESSSKHHRRCPGLVQRWQRLSPQMRVFRQPVPMVGISAVLCDLQDVTDVW
jgi:hypothetical protein